MNPKKNLQRLNIYFWSFIHLITTYPNMYLNENGKVIYKIVLDNGNSESLTKIAKYIKGCRFNVGKICREIENSGHISLIRYGNRKIICFNEKIIEEGLKIIKLTNK